LADGLIGFGTTPYDRQLAHQTFAQVERIFLKSLEIRRSGSAALDIAYVACGRLDGFFEQTLQPWDYAAGSIILCEAGGRITNWQGGPPSLRHGDSLLASNDLLHDILLDELLK
jgi:myo-inositol-1(or 4)-monophosphatase